MICEPALDAQIRVYGAATAGLDAVEETAVVHGKRSNARDTQAGGFGVRASESDELSSVIHADSMRYGYRTVNGKDTAFYRTSSEAIIRGMTGSLPDRLRRRLDALGLTPNGASVAAGQSRDYVRNILDRKSRSQVAEKVMSLARVLHVPPEFFQDGFDDAALYDEAGAALDKDGNPVGAGRGGAAPESAPSLIDRAASLLSMLPEEDQQHYIERLERDVRLLKRGDA